MDAAAGGLPSAAHLSILGALLALAVSLSPWAIAAALRDRLATPIASTPVPGIELAFDDEGSPWYTRCVASGSDRLGLLFALTSAFAAAGASVHAARIVTEATTAVDTFELSSSRSGGKLDEATKARIRDAVTFGITPPRRRFGARRGATRRAPAHRRPAERGPTDPV